MADAYLYLNRLYRPELVRLGSFAHSQGLSGSLWACVFHGGISGSFQDALAHYMLNKAQADGRLGPGGAVADEGSSPFGPALAWAAARLGHPVILAVRHNTEPGRIRLLEALGARLVYSTADDWQGLCHAAEMAAAKNHALYLNHFAGDDNAQFHRQLTAPAIFKALPEPAAIVAGITTCGTLTGVGEYARGHSPDTRMVGVESTDGPAISEGVKGMGSIAGLGCGFVPPLYNPYVIDTLQAVTPRDAAQCALDALRTEGLPADAAGGAVLAAGCAYMKKTECASLVCILGGQKIVG